MHSNNNELVKAGHDLAKALSADVPLTEIAKVITTLATQLDVTTAAVRAMQAERDQLAAECAGMDAFVGDLLAIAWQGCSADGADIQELALKHGLIRQEVYCQDQHENVVYDPSDFQDGDPVYFRVETPATDRFLAEQRALGVEMFADRKNKELFSLHPDTHAIGSIAAAMSAEVKELREFATQLRNEVKV